MKGKTTGRGLKALTVSLALGLGITACSRDYTVGYLYSTNAKANPGLISGFAIDYNTGQLTQLADSPIPSGGNNTVTLVATPGGKNLYVLNHDTSTVVQFDIGTDGKLYPENTYNVVQGNGATGTFPTAAAVDPSGSFLYITFTYQNGYTVARPGPGGVAIFPIAADGSLGAALTNSTVGTSVALPYFPVGDNPTAIVVSPNVTLTAAQTPTISRLNYIYVIDQETTTAGAAFGVLLTFSATVPVGQTTPVIAAVAGTFSNGVAAGTTPSAIAEDPAGHYVFVTDSTANQLEAFAVSASGPASTPAIVIPTGQLPDGITIDPRGLFLYVANYASSTVGTYTINASAPLLRSTGTVSVGTGPTCIAIDPALGIYLYTSNALENAISAEQLNPKTGALAQIQGTPYASQTLPSCLVSVTNGAHATQIVQ